MKFFSKILLIVSAAVFMTSCGGGGGSSAPAPAPVPAPTPAPTPAPMSYPAKISLKSLDVQPSDSIANTTATGGATAAKHSNKPSTNSSHPPAYTYDEYQASKKYTGGNLIDINPIFSYFETVEKEEAIQLEDSYGITITDSNDEPILVWKSAQGDNYYTENDQNVPVVLSSESNELRFDNEGKPIFVYATLTSCPIKLDESNNQIYVEISKEDGEIYTDTNGENISFRTAISSCQEAYENENPSYEKTTVFEQVEREVECDLSGLEIEIIGRQTLDFDKNHSLLDLNVPNEIINKDCEVSYDRSAAIVTQTKTYEVKNELEKLVEGGDWPPGGSWTYDNYFNVVPANLDGRNESNIPLLLVSYEGGEVGGLFEVIVDEFKNEVSFSQLGVSSLKLNNGNPFAYNGQHLLFVPDESNNISDREYYLIERGKSGFKILEPRLDSGLMKADDVCPLYHWNYSFRENGVLSLEDGTFLVIGNLNPCGDFALIYDPKNDVWVSRFGNYPEKDAGKSYYDYYGCETSDETDTVHFGMPRDQVNDRDQLICRDIKDIRLSTGSTSYHQLNGRYGDWFLSGISNPSMANIFQTPFEIAWNSQTFQSTGIINCYPHTKPTGANRITESCGPAKYSMGFRNYLFGISSNGRLYTRYNLDDQSEVHLDITDLGIVASNNFSVFKDLIMIDVTESEDGDRVWLEINFENGTVEEKGVIEQGGLKVVKFVQ